MHSRLSSANAERVGHRHRLLLAANATLMAGRHWLMFFPGVRLGGDIEVYGSTDFAVMLTPSGLAGGGVFDPDGRVDALGFFVLQPAFAVKFVILDRLLQLWVRPVAFDLLFFPPWYDGDFELDAIYSVMAGAFFAF